VNTTFAFKTRQRYTYGWTDPRTPQFRGLDIKRLYQTGLDHVETETLRNLWLIHFGGDYAVELHDMHAALDDPIMNVVKELASRGLVSEEMHRLTDTDEYKQYYVLNRMWGRDDGDN